MFTIILAWINAKYKAKYELLFLLTAYIDLNLLLALAEIFGKGAQ